MTLPDRETLFVASTDGVRLAVEVTGPRDGMPLILLHGGAQSRSAWRGGARAFAANGFRVGAMDLRGHGDSDWSRTGDYSFQRHIEDLTVVIDVLGGKAMLLGASLGGHVALLTAAQEPARVGALALADVTPWIDEDAADGMRGVMRSAAAGFDTIEAAAAMVDRLRGSGARDNAEGLRPHLRTHDDGRLYWRWDARFVEDRFVRHGGEGGLFAQAAARLTVPVLVMRGTLSDVTTPAQIDRFRREVPGIATVEVAGVGHMVTGENNDAYAAAAMPFLSSRRDAEHC